MAYFCPETGLRISSQPEWKNQKVSDTFTANFWIINESIIYSLPSGYADIQGVKNSLALNNVVASSLVHNPEAYIQIEDYFFLKGSSSEARKYFTDTMIGNKRLYSLIFCNMSHPISIAVRVRSRLNTTNRNIHVEKHYPHAIKRAVAMADRKSDSDNKAPINLKQYMAPHINYLKPVELHTNKNWDIKTPSYANQAVIIDRSILHSSSQGHLEIEHVALIDQMRPRCLADLPEGSKLEYIIVDSNGLTGGSRLARKDYMQSLKRWHQRFPIGLYIVYGANTFMKTALYLAKPLMPFRVTVAKDIGHAFQLVRDDKSHATVKKLPARDAEKTLTVTRDDYERLMAFIGNLNWETEGIDPRYKLDDDNPLFFLFQSIRLIKEELDDLFKERKNLERQLIQSRKMESLGTLAGGIAHEFNNILGIIIGNTEMAIDDVPEWNPAGENLKEIRTASLRARDIIRQIMSFSRKTQTVRKPINLSDVVHESLKLIRSTVPTNIDIQQKILANSEKILADPTEINQILINLCSNSVHAMAEDSGVLKLKLESVIYDDFSARQFDDLKPGKYVKLTWSDNGKGIEPEIIDQIFDPYFTTKEIDKGLGMGLAVVYGIMNKYEGGVTVNSETGLGTTIELMFPVTQEIALIERRKPGDLPSGTERILFIDDEASLVKLVKQILERLGYEVVGQTESREALEIFRKDPENFDMVISDVAIPEMPGDRLAREMIKIRPGIPIMLCTGHSDRLDESTAMDLGVKAFAMKPIRTAELAWKVRKVLDDAKNELPQ